MYQIPIILLMEIKSQQQRSSKGSHGSPGLGPLESSSMESVSISEVEHKMEILKQKQGDASAVSQKVKESQVIEEAEDETQVEFQFNMAMNKLIKMCPSSIVSLDVFKLGVDVITQKSYEDSLNFSVDELKAALQKSYKITTVLQKNLDKQMIEMEQRQAKIAYDFELMQDSRLMQQKIENKAKSRMEDQVRLQNWLKKSINQNIGVFKVHEKILIYDSRSLNLFGHTNSFRKWVVWLTEWKWFDYLVIGLIILGSACQAIQSSFIGEDQEPSIMKMKYILEEVMNVTSYFFIFEATMKIISQGMIRHKNAYLRDEWNIVDFIVVLSSIFEFAIVYANNDSSVKINMLRGLRVLRPLRSVKRVPSMRRLVTIMLRSLPELGNTLVFMTFFFIVFGIIGIQTFHGSIYQRCRLTKEPVDGIWQIDPEQSDFICSSQVKNLCREGTFCGSPILYTLKHGIPIDLNLSDHPWKDPLIIYNTVNFNNLPNAVTAIFEALTLEGWSTQMYFMMDTGSGAIAICFYLLLVVFGSYFILNLILAVIMGSFTKFENQEIETKIIEAEKNIMKKLQSMGPVFQKFQTHVQVPTSQKAANEGSKEDLQSKESQKDSSTSVNQIKKQLFSMSSKKNSNMQLGSINNDAESPKSNILTPNPVQSKYLFPQADLVKSLYRQQTNLEVVLENPFEKKPSMVNSAKDKTGRAFDSVESDQSQDEDEDEDEEEKNEILRIQRLKSEKISRNELIRNYATQNIAPSNGSILEISDEDQYTEMNYEGGRRIKIVKSPQSSHDKSLEKGSPSPLRSKERGSASPGKGCSSPPSAAQKDKMNKKKNSIVSFSKNLNLMAMSQQSSQSNFVLPSKLKVIQPKEFEELQEETFLESCVTKFSNFNKKMSKRYSKTCIRRFFASIINNQYFTIFILLSITVNTVTLSMDRYPIELKQAASLESINNVTTWIFVFEMVVKVLGMGIKTYAQDSMNQFDAIVVIISIIEFILVLDQKEGDQKEGDNMSLTIFRGFRLLRVFRLFRRWKTFHKMMVKIGQTLKDILTFFVLLLIIVFVFSLLGVELFGGKTKINEDNEIVPLDDPNGFSPRQNFDSFPEGFVSVFICLIGEDWQILMHDQMRSKESRLAPSLFFIFLMILGNLFLMNLFLAILLKNFEEKKNVGDEEEEQHEDDEPPSLNKSIQIFYQTMKVKFRRVIFNAEREESSSSSQQSIDDLAEGGHSHDHGHGNGHDDAPKDDHHHDEHEHLGHDHHHEVLTDEQQIEARKMIFAKNYIQAIQKKRRQSKAAKSLIESQKIIILQGRSLFIFKQNNKFRLFLSKIVAHKTFEMFIFSVVIFSAVLMGLEDPLQDPEWAFTKVFAIINNVITGIFVTELIMKVIVYGLIFNYETSFLRNGWNCLDCIIVIFSITSIIVEKTSESGAADKIELLKMLRVLRSLRMISRNEGLKLSVLSLIYSLPGILNVTVVSSLFLLLFGIFFLNILKGKFYHCHFPENLKINMDLIDTKYDCVNYGGHWKNENIHFDDIPNALLSLFTMSTTEGWVVFMNDAVDSRGIGLQPKRGQNPVYQYVFIVYMIFGSLFITNLFIEVVINTFDREKRAVDRNDRLTYFQKEYIQLQLKCYNAKPETKINTDMAIRKYCISIVEHKYFDPFIMIIIILNAVILTFVWIGISQDFQRIIEYIQEIFNGIFITECLLKLIAYRKLYFQNGWNNFDFIVVLGGLYGLVNISEITQQLSVFRILRVCRVLRLLKKAKRLYIIFNSFLHTIPAFVNVGSLITVLIYIFSVLGNRIFADIKLSGTLTQHKNFQTFPKSYLTLITVMTGEGWYEIMNDLERQNEVDFECIESPTYYDYKSNDFETVGCGTKASRVFFVLYVFSVSLILVNLFIAVTLQGFNDVQSEDDCRITDYQLQIFINVWKDLDPDGTGYIHISEAPSLMRHLIEKKCDLFPPNAKDLVFDPELLSELIIHLELKLYKKFQYYNFHDILISLSQMYLTSLAGKEQELNEILTEYNQLNKNQFPAEDLDDVIEKIGDIQQEKNVQMCKKLDEQLLKFKNNVVGKIDQFDGNIYTSSMIPIVIKIQQIFREKKKQRKQAELDKEIEDRIKFKRQAAKKGITLDSLLLKAKTYRTDDQQSQYFDMASYLAEKNRLNQALQFKLDLILRGKKEEAMNDGVTVQQLIDMQKQLAKCRPKHCKNLKGKIEVCNSQESLMSAKKEEMENVEGSCQMVKLENYRTYQPDEIKNALKLYEEHIKKKEEKTEPDIQKVEQEEVDFKVFEVQEIKIQSEKKKIEFESLKIPRPKIQISNLSNRDMIENGIDDEAPHINIISLQSSEESIDSYNKEDSYQQDDQIPNFHQNPENIVKNILGQIPLESGLQYSRQVVNCQSKDHEFDSNLIDNKQYGSFQKPLSNIVSIRNSQVQNLLSNDDSEEIILNIAEILQQQRNTQPATRRDRELSQDHTPQIDVQYQRKIRRGQPNQHLKANVRSGSISSGANPISANFQQINQMIDADGVSGQYNESIHLESGDLLPNPQRDNLSPAMLSIESIAASPQVNQR